MAQYEAFVAAALKSRPDVTEDMIDGLLMTYFIFVLKDESHPVLYSTGWKSGTVET